MLITRTPFRVSLFGGGTDIPEFFRAEEGHVLSLSIDKYCYVSIRDLPKYFPYTIKLSYSTIETCKEFNEIKHPLIRAALSYFNTNDIEIHYDADLPGRSGLGTSSSFCVGLVQSLNGLKGQLISKKEIAKTSIHIERNLLKEYGGYQDQIAAAYGGLNYIKFLKDSTFNVTPYPLTKSILESINNRMLLCYVPKTRLSSDHSIQKNIADSEIIEKLKFIKEIVNEAIKCINSTDLDRIGVLLAESWKYKKSFKEVSTEMIDEIYEKGIKSGAIGGKLLGAGGGGFILFWCKEGERELVSRSLIPLITVPFNIENTGSQVIYYKD